jgi:hypothetical protein
VAPAIARTTGVRVGTVPLLGDVWV